MKKKVAIISCIAIPLLSAKIVHAKSTIGGIVFVNSFYESKDDGNDTITRSVVDIANNSRFRIRWSNEDNVGMYIESAIGDSVSLRHAYGTWDINENWQILAGQTSTPFAPLDPEVAMVNNSGQSVGNTSPGRRSQVRFTYKLQNRRGAFALAFLDPNSGGEIRSDDGVEIGERSSVLPRIDIGGAYSTFNWQIFPSAFIHQQDYDNVAENVEDDSLTIWGAALGARRGFGSWVLSAEYGIGENWGNTQMSLNGSPAGDNAGAILYQNLANNDVIADNENENFWIDLGYRFSSKETQGVVHFLVGQSTSTVDVLAEEYTSSMIGISAPIDLPWIARGVRIRPEIFYFDNGDNNRRSVLNDDGSRISQEFDSGSHTIVGVQLQYTF